MNLKKIIICVVWHNITWTSRCDYFLELLTCPCEPARIYRLNSDRIPVFSSATGGDQDCYSQQSRRFQFDSKTDPDETTESHRITTMQKLCNNNYSINNFKAHSDSTLKYLISNHWGMVQLTRTSWASAWYVHVWWNGVARSMLRSRSTNSGRWKLEKTTQRYENNLNIFYNFRISNISNVEVNLSQPIQVLSFSM